MGHVRIICDLAGITSARLFSGRPHQALYQDFTIPIDHLQNTTRTASVPRMLGYPTIDADVSVPVIPYTNLFLAPGTLLDFFR